MNDDDTSVLVTEPAASTLADASSDVGTYDIILSAGSDSNYSFTENAGVLTISKAGKTITFEAIDDQIIQVGTLNLEATVSSGLTISYEIVSGPATVADKVVTFTGLGIVNVRASQVGNGMYSAANDVTQSFEVVTVTDVEEGIADDIMIYPNPASQFVNINAVNIVRAELIGVNGKVMVSTTTNQLDIRAVVPGNYWVRIITDKKTVVQQLVKK